MAAMTLTQLRDYVRRQTQTTIGELPDVTVDAYLQEGFNRTVAYENQWPWFEKTWTLSLLTDAYKIEIPVDCNVSGITGLIDRAKGWRVPLTAHTTAQDTWGARQTQSDYLAYSAWAGQFVLWPNTPSPATKAFDLTGFRYATDWITAGPSSTPDIDPRLHSALAHFAIALAYAQQEDETLEASYMQRWQMDVNTVRGAVMEPSQDRPLIMGPHRFSAIGRGGRGGPSIVINTP